jgi:uncharacterized protein YjbJ (UPF0337 family)
MAKTPTHDKLEGAADKVKGRVREAAGAMTGSTSEKAKGQGDQLKGTAKKKKGHIKDLGK